MMKKRMADTSFRLSAAHKERKTSLVTCKQQPHKKKKRFFFSVTTEREREQRKFQKWFESFDSMKKVKMMISYDLV